jgi:hypothetical protein
MHLHQGMHRKVMHLYLEAKLFWRKQIQNFYIDQPPSAPLPSPRKLFIVAGIHSPVKFEL